MTQVSTVSPGERVGSFGVLPAAPPVVRMLGGRVCPATIDQLHEMIAQTLARRERIVISSQNLHSLRLVQRDTAVRALHERSYPRIDGMPLVWIGRLLGYPLRRDQRVTWVDWLPRLMEQAVAQRWRVFYLGTKPEVVARGTEHLRDRYPGIELASHHGYFDASADSADNQRVLDAIAAFKPDVLMVGMGMPRQERWVLENEAELPRCAVLTCGAALDYVAGATPTPPRWMGRLGLEWLHRLSADPRRLWRRYLVEPWPLLLPLMRDLIAHRLRRSSSGDRP